MENGENKTDNRVDKRALRRKRRLRNQIMAYITMLIVLAVIAMGGFFAVRYIMDRMEKQPQEQPAEDIKQQVNDLINEPEISQPDPEEYVPELTAEEKLDGIVDAAIEAMPLEEKVAGLFFVTPEAITGVDTAVKAGDGTKDALNANPVGGLIYFKKNIKSQEQLAEMIANSLSYSRYPLFIAVDEEGGTVSRVADSGIGTNVGKASDIGATGDPANAYNAGQTIAGYLTPLGFNVDFAPVADINNVEGSVIGSRSYGSDPNMVASMVSSMVKGLEENGVSACLKHFPGIGSSTEDTHDGMADTDRTAEEFRAEEFVVFQAGIDSGVDFIMITHMMAPGLTGDEIPVPSVFSKTIVTDILRNELHFNGVIITDALNMTVITEYYDSGDAAVRALKAGCDMLLMPEDYKAAYEAVLAAVQDGTISEERINDSLRRIYRIKYADILDD
ncbi:MAG: beta-N-acetylhexosaminidase [Lachnospiraceae bacterium]|nr:beta-N-acetylhexosaminidase [Lachnospiraceae bacterium]